MPSDLIPLSPLCVPCPRCGGTTFNEDGSPAPCLHCPPITQTEAMALEGHYDDPRHYGATPQEPERESPYICDSCGVGYGPTYPCWCGSYGCWDI